MRKGGETSTDVLVGCIIVEAPEVFAQSAGVVLKLVSFSCAL